MERSHYCLHSEHLFIQGFSTLLSLFREYRRVGEIVVSKAKFFTCLSLHQKKLHARSDIEKKEIEELLNTHQSEAKIEENFQVGMNQILGCIASDATFAAHSNQILRLDVDPAANLTYPHFGEEQVAIGDVMSITMFSPTLSQTRYFRFSGRKHWPRKE